MIRVGPTLRVVCLDCANTNPGVFTEEYYRDGWVEAHVVQTGHRVALIPPDPKEPVAEQE